MQVFVYGTLRRGLRYHRLLRRARFRGRHTTAPRFTMFDLGAYPGVVATGTTAIVGEVYTVDRATLARLDRLEGYPLDYDRARIETPYGLAWIYLYRRPHGHRRRVVSGDWKKRD